MPATENIGYTGKSQLMDNYGWVQNTSNLSTVRDTVDLVPSDGIDHNSLMRMIYLFRQEKGDLKKKWEWDARCRIKAICATGMVELDRSIAGYRLTPLGEELKQSPHSTTFFRGKRVLSSEEKEILKKGLLTNPPVIRVLAVLNDSRRNGNVPLSKYEVGSQLGFVGDIGFTHFEAEYVALMGKSFNDKEGDADKWARTIISWLSQVGWVITADSVEIYGRTLPRYTTTFEVDRVLQYNAKSTTKYVPQEMLCSDHHAFPKVVQERRVSIIKELSNSSAVKVDDLLAALNSDGIEIDTETLKFDLINLKQAGINIEKELSYYRLADRIKLDVIPEKAEQKENLSDVEKKITHYVTTYADTLPARLVDNLIRFGYGGTESAAQFEAAVDKFFKLLGYESNCLGQGHGRVADVIAKYKTTLYPRSYGLIIDAKAYARYTFPAGDVRKMKEYIDLHGAELLSERIPNHAFAFISMDFVNPDDHLEEIATDTAVNGTAITVFELFKLGDSVIQQKESIANLYPKYTTNKLFRAG